MITDKMVEAIERALYLILAAEHEADWPAYAAGVDSARDVLRAALAQPQAAPVAWAFQHDETGRWTVQMNDGVNTPESFARLNPRYGTSIPLYTAPPTEPGKPRGAT
jgi:hypothetical protein